MILFLHVLTWFYAAVPPGHPQQRDYCKFTENIKRNLQTSQNITSAYFVYCNSLVSSVLYCCLIRWIIWVMYISIVVCILWDDGLNLNEASLKCARLINTLPVEWRWDTLTASSSARIVWVGFERDLMNYNGASPALLSVIWLSGRLNLVIRLIIQMHCCSLHQHSSTMQCSKRAHAHFIMDF